MVKVTKDGDAYLFDVQGLHKLWAFKSQLQIPAQHILGARQDPEGLGGWWKGWRLPGTSIPGLITAGTFYLNDKQVFWDVHDPAKAVIIDLAHEDYDRLIIEVEDPAAVVALLSAKQ